MEREVEKTMGEQRSKIRFITRAVRLKIAPWLNEIHQKYYCFKFIVNMHIY